MEQITNIMMLVTNVIIHLVVKQQDGVQLVLHVMIPDTNQEMIVIMIMVDLLTKQILVVEQVVQEFHQKLIQHVMKEI